MRQISRDAKARALCARHLIDSGAIVKDLGAIEEGRGLIQSLLVRKTKSTAVTAALEYNLTNSFAAEYHIFSERGDLHRAREALREQRERLQRLLLEKELGVDLQIMAHTNLANALDETGRTIEAIDHYNIAWSLDLRHMLAKGNCGTALCRLASASHTHGWRNFDAGLALLQEACGAPDDVRIYANDVAVGRLEKRLKQALGRIERRKDGVAGFENWRAHRREAHGQPACGPWLARVLTDRLLLSLNQFPLASAEEARDDLFFATLSSGIDTGSEQWALGLIYLLNAIKEEYATARFLYYQALDASSPELVACDKVTQYADPGSFARFGLDVGLLKTGFRVSIDILDKIAFFLNQYLRLGQPEDRVDFRNVWYADCSAKKGEHPTLGERIKSRNWLRALSDMREDWFADRFPGRFRDLRNIGTHRGLILFSAEGGELSEEIKTVQDHARETLLMLRTAKAAIEYLVLFIDEEEKARRAADNGRRSAIRHLGFRAGGTDKG
ncbi:MAG TPA: LA2681 family HEPN domain-containing protein [Terriglobia bacterium]|nr:LA2681 family HEPN domain-containing protein [Terriglobia bacterium]